MLALASTQAQAQYALEPLRGRVTAGAAMMVSSDQVGRLGYDRIGLLGALQLGYAFAPAVGLELAMAGGAFASEDQTGGLLAPALGMFVRVPGRSIEPHAFVHVGPGFTGPLMRPLLELGIGVDFTLTRAIALGPLLGYSQLFQPDSDGASTDARFLWLGVSLYLRPFAPAPTTSVRERVVTKLVRVQGPERPPPPAAPTEELMALIEGALPSTRTELLAPVLFAFDSDELEPVGIAMLHEVARELAARTDLELVEIEGYADRRGSDEYNAELSARRAERVRVWLVEHGVAAERLVVAGKGESSVVEEGSSEAEQEQNRRVVFRVLQQKAR